LGDTSGDIVSDLRRTPNDFKKLEGSLDPDWWKKIFNLTYLKTDADVVSNEKLTRLEVDLVINSLDLDRDERLLDVCCGHGRHVLELAKRGFKYVEGLDYSNVLIEVAKKRAASLRLNVAFKIGDARSLPYPDSCFDAVIMMGNSFGYFADPRDDVKVIREIWRVLRPYGRFLIDISDGEKVRSMLEKRSWEWADQNTLVARERELSSDGDRVITREIVLDTRKGLIADNIYAIRIYTYNKLKSLLEEQGFVNVSLVTNLEVSNPSRDSGLMSSRIIVRALAAKNNNQRSGCKNVVVLLGDPNHINNVKPGKRFDEDDEYAVNELKSALYGIDGYNFFLFDNHPSMIRYLLENRDKIDLVFNLCDDGFFNDPFKEPHIAAFLEMLNIPYTGASFRCLTLCYDKAAVKSIVSSLGIPTPNYVLITDYDMDRNVRLRYPVIVKPNFGDNSWGIGPENVIYSPSDLSMVIEKLRSKWGYHGPILVEEFMEGADLTVSIIGNPPSHYIVLPILEEDYSKLPPNLPRVCTYDAKWNPNSVYGCVNSRPACLAPHIVKQLTSWSVKAFIRLECRDYARFDWRIGSDGLPRLLEVNPNPGWVWDGHLRKACRALGWSYKRMLKEILKAAESRLNKSRKSLMPLISLH
jgi:D-alanine-D-alanine ligase